MTSVQQSPGKLSRDEKNKILRERAQALAKKPEETNKEGQHFEIVEFQLADERYGIESGFVQEIYPLKELTQLPFVPSFVMGIINVRGQVLSVIDLKKFFDLPDGGLTDLNKVIIIKSEKMEFGVLADAVIGVKTIPVADLQPPMVTLTGIRLEYLKGITDEQLVVLDASKILSDKGIIVHEEVD
jgi:purine-binding chemotaxis protein CheW